MRQLPESVEGTAAGVMIYSIICLLGSLTMIWLTWHHRERTSYIAFLAYFITISTITSIVQQIHTILRWRDIARDMFLLIRSNPYNAELLISNGAAGMDRTLYFIQLYCYQAQSLFFMFWAWAVVQSVFSLNTNPKLQRPLKIFGMVGKVFSVFFPLLIILLLQNESIQARKGVFLLLAGQPLFWSLGLGSIAMMIVAGRYIYFQRRVRRASNLNMIPVPVSSSSSRSILHRRTGSKGTVGGRRSMYDRWLITRFAIACVFQAVFEVTIVLFSTFSQDAIKLTVMRSTPDDSAEKAEKTFLFFMPGVTSGILLFIVFGTTKPCLQSIQNIFTARTIKDVKNITSTSTSPTIPLSGKSSTIPLRDQTPMPKPQKSYQSMSKVLMEDERARRAPKPERKQKDRLMKPLPPLPPPPNERLAQRPYLNAGVTRQGVI